MGIVFLLLMKLMLSGGNGDGRRYMYNASKFHPCFDLSFLCSCGLPQFIIGLEILNGFCLPYTSLPSILAGALMGISCGLVLFAPSSQQVMGGNDEDHTGGDNHGVHRGTYRVDEWNDNDSNVSSMASDLEEAFNPNIQTPPRNGRFDIPPAPSFSPTPSSKGLDTPIMRRSIIKSPEEEDDEIDTLRSLNTPGFTGGLKQRNTSKNKSNYNTEMHCNDDMYSSKQLGRSRGMHWSIQPLTLQFLGVLLVISILTIPVLFIGYSPEPADGQAVTDSMYGCKRLHGFYQYAQADEEAAAGV